MSAAASERVPALPNGWQDAIAVAAEPGFRRWRQQVALTGGCANPIHLTGESRLIAAATGEVVQAYSTLGEPGERILVACGDRRASRCQPCSERYRADTYQLIRAGLTGGKSVPDSVRDHPKVFATFTAPSFGPVHHRVVGPDDKVRRCHPRGQPRCRRRHRVDDPLLGSPLDPDRYDYHGAVVWNGMAPHLWEKTMDLLTKQLARLAGYSQRVFASVGRRSFGKVAEVQARGLAHFHAVIRLDGIDPDDPRTVIPPGPWASVELLDEAIRVAVSLAVVVAADGTEIRWGEQLDVRPIGAVGVDEDLTDEAVAGYIAKYSTKGAECAGTVDRPLWCRACNGSGKVQTRHARVDCDRCAGTGSHQNLDGLPVSEHARRMIQTCWQLGDREELAGLRLRQWAHALGYGGHFSSKSRRYSTTLSALRAARQDYQTARTLRAFGLADDTPVVRGQPTVDEVDADSVLVIGHWRYAGRGHSTGQAIFARTIAQDIADNRRHARQAMKGDPWDAA